MSDIFTITIDATGSLVTVEFIGHIAVAGLQTYAAQVAAMGAKVRPPFAVLVDLTRLEQMDLECAAIVSQAMDQWNRMGVTRVVRVIPDPQKDIGLGILSLFHYQSGVEINTVPTRGEADRLAR